MAPGFGVFGQVRPLREEEKLERLFNVAEIIQHGFKMASILLPLPADEDEGGDLHRPTESRDGLEAGLEADLLQPEVAVSQ